MKHPTRITTWTKLSNLGSDEDTLVIALPRESLGPIVDALQHAIEYTDASPDDEILKCITAIIWAYGV